MIYNPEKQTDVDEVSDFLQTMLKSATSVDRTLRAQKTLLR